jgi:outer membrane protein assembly factor BamB
MGFLIKYIFIVTGLIFLAGCATSKIKIEGSKEKAVVYPMYGKSPAREFYSPVIMSDSLVIKWEAEANGSFHQNSVTYYGRNLFINDLSGRIYCYDFDTGKIKGRLKHKGAIYTTPVIYGYNVIYLEALPNEDQSVFRIYNFLEAKTIAEKEIKGRVLTEIILINKEVYFVTEKGLLYKYSHLGDEYWVKDLNSSFHSSPASDGNYIFLFNDDGELLKINGKTGDIVFREKTGRIVTTGLTLNNNIYAGDKDGFVSSFNRENGSVIWKYKTTGKLTAVPVIHRDKIYAVNLSGEAVCLDSETGKEIWRSQVGGVLNVTPLLTDNYLIVPDLAGRIVLVDINNGEEKKVIELPNRAKLSPVIIENVLMIGYDRGILRAYEIL